jgi:hypothetical protein
MGPQRDERNGARSCLLPRSCYAHSIARPLRLEFAGALYHVTARGDGREDIYLDEADRRNFYALLGEVSSRLNWLVYAECQ